MTKERSHSLLIKSKNLLPVLLILVAFLLCYLTLHDFQTAQGVGLYLSIQFGSDNLPLFNLLVDCSGMLLLFLALFLPVMVMKRMRFESFFRFFAVYLAFIPVIRPASLVHLGNTFSNLSTRLILSAENPSVALLESVADTVLLLRMVLPLLLILLWVNLATAASKIKKWQICIIVAVAIFIILNILYPELSAETSYFINYLLLVWCFHEWEKICDRNPGFSNWGMILFGGCWLRGIYRMIEVMSISKL